MSKFTTPVKQGSLMTSSSAPRLTTPRGTLLRNNSPIHSCFYICVFKCNRMVLGMTLLTLSYFLTMSPLGKTSMLRRQTTQNLRWDAPAAARLDTSYDAYEVPIVLSPRKVQVHFVTDASAAQSPASKSILEGLERSQFSEIVGLTLAQPQAEERQQATLQVFERNEDWEMVYVVDWGSMNRDCHILEIIIHHLELHPDTDRLLLLDFSASSRNRICRFFHEFKKLKIAKRSMVENRHYDDNDNWIESGQLISTGDYDFMHTPLVLPERFVDTVKNISSHYSLEEKKQGRLISVSFFWKQGDYAHYSMLRKKVAEQVAKVEGSQVNISTGDSYISSLLKSKIVVVAQRDEWEDHYRLMEALASGALVLTDPMLAIPGGLENNTNVVIYDSLENIQSLINYYLEHDIERTTIARRGYELAMGRHRTWHRMEEVLFGSALTNVDKPYAPAPEKQERPELKLIKR